MYMQIQVSTYSNDSYINEMPTKYQSRKNIYIWNNISSRLEMSITGQGR